MIPEKLVVITSFPTKGIIHDEAVVGIASYAKNTLLALKSAQKGLEITVLAEILSRKEAYEDEGISVKRTWKRGSFLLFPHLLREILSIKDTKNILIEFEVAMFGNFAYLLPFPLFLLFLKIMGKKITIVSHQVIPNIADLSGHLNLNSKLKTYLLNLCIHTFYRVLSLLSSRIIVFDKILKDKLSNFADANKIKIIPHGVEIFQTNIDKKEAKKKLKLAQNDFTLLYFGYLAWYKGADLLVEAYRKFDNSQIKLILAGGPNPNHIGKAFYQYYVQKIENECRKKNILLTGFVKEKDIPLYFIASDIVILPYRTLMSASGPLSIALSFNKPFLVSKALADMFETEDIKNTLNDLGIDKNDLIFEESDIQSKIMKVKEDGQFRDKLEELSKILANKRSWEEIGKQYYHEIFLK